MARRARLLPPITRCVEALGDPRSVPDVDWIASLTGRRPAEVERVLLELGNFVDTEEEIRSRHLRGGRENYAQFRAPFELYAMVRLLEPSEIVETGVSSGVSSAHFLLGLRGNRHGRLHSIDAPMQQKSARLGIKESIVSLPPGHGSGWSVPDELRDGWDLQIGRSEKLLPALVAGLDRVDIFLHDSLHTPEHLTFELETIRPKLHRGSIVMADNTQWTGRAFDEFAASLDAPVLARRREDLVGLAVPPDRRTKQLPRTRGR